MGAFHDERQIYQFPIQRPQQFRHVRDGDSGLLRGGHWHPSQLETNEASEPEQLNCHFILMIPSVDSVCSRKGRGDRRVPI